MTSTESFHPVTVQCLRCGQQFETESFHFGGQDMTPKFCTQCGQIAEAEKRHQELDERSKEHWKTICPIVFRTIEEGGETDVDRLFQERPQLAEILKCDYSKKGLLVRGDSGEGKSRIVWRVLRRDWNAEKRLFAYRAREFEAEYRDADGNHKLKKFLNENINARFFYLDDLGKAQWSQNAIETFFDIIEARTDHLRPCFITTQFDASGLSVQLKLDKNMADALWRRLRENCHCFSV